MVCRDCTIIEHPVNQCNVISVKEHIFAKPIQMSMTSMFVDEKAITISAYNLQIQELENQIKKINASATIEKNARDAAKKYRQRRGS